jgi:hypothetical protein
MLIGCGGSSGGNAIPFYNIQPLPLDNTVLTSGFNQSFSMELTAQQDMTIDALLVDIAASPVVDTFGVEVRDETTNTLSNSVIRFPFRPTYPLRLSIPINRFIPAGGKKVFVIFVDVAPPPRASSLQIILLNVVGTATGGAPLPVMEFPIQGPLKTTGP